MVSAVRVITMSARCPTAAASTQMSAMNWRIAGGDAHQRQQLGGPRDHGAQPFLVAVLVGGGVARRPLVALHDPHAVVERRQPADVDAEPEAIEQLRAQLALLGVHGADEHQPGRV